MPAVQRHVAPEPHVLIPPDMPDGLNVPDGAWRHLTGDVFGTTWRIDVVSEAMSDESGWLQMLRQRCCAVMDNIDAQMSPWRKASDLVRFNNAAPGSRVVLPEPMRTVVGKALEIAELTQGAFDPALQDAVSVWGFSADAVAGGLPSDDVLEVIRKQRAHWRDLAFDGTAILAQPGLALDLCAVAKGFAVDAVMDAIQATPGALSALVEIGGELKGWGLRADAMPWWVGLDTTGEPGTQQTLVALCDWAIATSGNYRRQFLHDGVTYCHMIDPQTCAPVRNDVVRVTVLDPECARADALATALMVMGRAAALSFAETHAIPCLIVCRSGDELREYMSHALIDWLND